MLYESAEAPGWVTRKIAMDIAETLRSYDGKRVAPFRAVAEAVGGAPGRAVPELLTLAASDEAALQAGATWVVKYLAERGNAPQGESAERVIDLLERVREPDAVLHLLQTLPHLEIPADRRPRLGRALKRLIRSRRAFIRAWAYNGLGLLATADPALRPEVEALLDAAEATESPAVRVRIRHARAGLGPAGGQELPAPGRTALSRPG